MLTHPLISDSEPPERQVVGSVVAVKKTTQPPVATHQCNNSVFSQSSSPVVPLASCKYAKCIYLCV